MSRFRFIILFLISLSLLAISSTPSQAEEASTCPYLQVVYSPVPGHWRRTDAAFQEGYRRSFAAHINRVGFKIVDYDEIEQSTPWYLNSQVLNLRNGTFVWSWSFEKQPSVRDGLLHFTHFRNAERAGGDNFFSGVRGLLVLTPATFDGSATKAAKLIADVFLAHAQDLCANQGSTLDELIALRKELVLEIARERARTRKAFQLKTLNLEIEE